MASAILTLIKALPEILVLIQQIQAAIKANELDHTVKDGVKQINAAFEKNDVEALNALFRNSK